ncbi:hypothetical protein OGATHE_005172 [Ogataea polymorpha]|uniref:Uncharacterized protein n=1 Tax=Ogataea polymorpha TaxID=460523 RepID=A0A9P8NW47_9ASCO|nr:hypothetical protein OGATHE_005172 [Ogataea polymorpha]
MDLGNLLVWVGSQIQRKSFRSIELLLSVDSDQSITSFEKSIFQADNDKLEIWTCVLGNIISNFVHVSVIEGRIDFIQHKEW